MFERAFILTGFIIRIMFEKKLVTDKLMSTEIQLKAFPCTGLTQYEKPWRSDSGSRAFEKYINNQPVEIKISHKELANQIVHCSHLSIIEDYGSLENGILLASDYLSETKLIHLPITLYKQIIKTLLEDKIIFQSDGFDPKTGKVFSIRD